MLQITNIKLKNKSFKVGALISLAFLVSLPTAAHAETIEISGNGSDSVSQVSSQTEQTTTVNQNNEATVNNDVNTDANTGENSTSGITGGENSIETGNVSTEIAIENSGNINNAEAGCCDTAGESTTVISGNGANSINQADINKTTTTSINGSNNANITNNISGSANTGNNTANNNTNGNVSIKTGDINVKETIKNAPFNVNNAITFINSNEKYSLKIDGNGKDSKNIINLNIKDENEANVKNAIDILNESVWLLNTGNNYADNNTDANVNIVTGDISFIADILNGPININNVEIKCCEEKENPEPPTGGVTPVTPPPATTTTDSKPSENKSSDDKKDEVLAAAIGSILPVTGSYDFLLYLIGSVALFFLGFVLRLRSGRSPGSIAAL